MRGWESVFATCDSRVRTRCVDRAQSRRVHKLGPYHGDTRLVLVFGAMVLEIMGCHCWPRTRFGRVEE